MLYVETNSTWITKIPFVQEKLQLFLSNQGNQGYHTEHVATTVQYQYYMLKPLNWTKSKCFKFKGPKNHQRHQVLSVQLYLNERN